MDATSHLRQVLCSLAASVLIVLLGLDSAAFALDIDDDELRSVHRRAAAQYSSVRQMSAVEFDTLRSRKSNDLLIIDVREKAEYAVSRIRGAVRATPGIAVEEFLSQIGESARGRTVIFYCSVGVRSMQLAARVQNAAKAAGVAEIYNLAGGVFNWHNQSRPLASANGPTELIHPYNWLWSRLIKRRHLISYRATSEFR